MSKNNGKHFKEKMKSGIIFWTVCYGLKGLVYGFWIFLVGFIVWEVVGLEKWVFPKTYWSKEVENIEASIRTEEAFLALYIKRLNSRETNSTKNQGFDEYIEILIASNKAQGKSEEEINKMILMEKEKGNKIEAQVNLLFVRLKEAEQEEIDKRQRQLATERQKLEFAKMQLIKYRGK